MPTELSLACACGTVRGTTDGLHGGGWNRVVCYCDDCQAFARWLGRDDVTDPRGGTDIVQVGPARVRLTDGLDHVRLVRLSDGGLLRWYTDCCRSPAGNMLAATWSPFVGLATRFIAAPTGAALDALIGPPIGAIHGRFARGGCPPQAHPKIGIDVLLRSAWFFLRGLVTGQAQPSPYFTGGHPRTTATVLSPAERAALYRRD